MQGIYLIMGMGNSAIELKLPTAFTGKKVLRPGLQFDGAIACGTATTEVPRMPRARPLWPCGPAPR